MNDNFINFYPTPKELFRDITSKLHWWTIDGILEPSAGKGNMVDYILEERLDRNIDCIEINPELQATLKGKGYSVIHDDFLTFIPKYHYDLILMNPPFDMGAAHLLKAIDIQKNGGKIICILNAETIRNPYTNERKVLVQKLEDLNAKIEYREDEFTSAERTTNVEIAVVYIDIPEKNVASVIFENLKQKYYTDQKVKEVTDIVDNDYLSAAVTRFNIEVDAGIKLIREYKAMKPYIMETLNKDNEYAKPTLSLYVGDKGDLSEISYVRKVRRKYWEALFKDKRFIGPMTESMRTEYNSKVRELEKYDFSISNIKELQIQMCGNLIKGIEDTIMSLFDELSYKHSWAAEFGNNIHYYNGWATNKAWYVNNKVVLPSYAWSKLWNKFDFSYSVSEKFGDIEKAFNYLAGCPGAEISIYTILRNAEYSGQTKNIECKYFTLTFYKKGTVHITFKDPDLVKKLNIFAGKNKNMLPPSYGTKAYSDMTTEEKAVVDEFDGGEEEYNKIYSNPEKYLVQNTSDLLRLEETA